MNLLLKLALLLSYTAPPTDVGACEPSLLLRAIGGWNDIAAIDDGDLLPPTREHAAPCKALEKLRMAEAANPEDDGEDFTKLRIMRNDKWDQAFVVRMMKRYEESFALLDEMMAEPGIRFEIPPPGTAETNDVFTLLGFSRIYYLRTRMRHLGSDWEGALDSLRDLNRYANFSLGSPGPLVGCLVGMAIERNMFEAAEELINDPDLPPELTPRIGEILADGPNRRALLIRAWREEYLYQKRTLHAVAHGFTFDMRRYLFLILDEKPGPIDHLRTALGICGQQAAVAFAVQPNRAQQKFARCAEHLIALTGLTYAERERVALPPELSSADRTWRDYLHPDGVTDYAMRNLAPQYLQALRRADEITAYREALLAVWGIRRFEQLNFRLPATLGELVPDILAAIPRDPYDGGRVNYLREKERVWVVGEDLSDDGGMDSVRRGFRARDLIAGEDKSYDPTLYLEWRRKDPAPAQ